MLEMSNGYPPSASPLGGSPSPGPSPALGVGGGANKGNPPRHSPQPPPPPPPPHPHRANLRVVIPTPLAQSLSEDTNYDVITSCFQHNFKSKRLLTLICYFIIL